MCGICGIFVIEKEQQVERETLESMNRRMAHRGPDDDGVFLHENIGLGMRRLSVIDLNTGQQPLSNPSGDIWIVFNGEIYNHRQLRSRLESQGHSYRTQSDTETILHLYEQYGAECVLHLRGMFAFAIWDGRKRCLFAARDRLGIKPFYYHWNGSTFVFGSEIKAVLAGPGVPSTFNRSSLAEFLAFGYTAQADTMFEGIFKLMPGHTLKLDESGSLQIERYWQMPADPDSDPKPQNYYANKYRELLEDAVSSHLMSDVPLGVLLSGGLDSSAVAALSTKIQGAPMQTFSVGYAERAYSELNEARDVSRYIGSEHQEVQLGRQEFFDVLPMLTRQEDEPLAWPSSVALYCVARTARKSVKVVLTGEGSDETLGGYGRYGWTLLNCRMDAAYRKLAPDRVRIAVRNGLESMPAVASVHRKLRHTFLMRDGNSWPSIYFDNFYAAFSAAEQVELMPAGAVRLSGDAYAASMLVWQESQGDLLHRMLYTDINTYLVELLMKQDQMSMAASVESRVPFLDHPLVEFTARIPGRYSVRRTQGKLILKDAVADLLPKSVIHGKKKASRRPGNLG